MYRVPNSTLLKRLPSGLLCENATLIRVLRNTQNRIADPEKFRAIGNS